MPSPEPFLIFTRTLNELGIRYMVSGSVAAIYYGEPRLTNDVDIILGRNLGPVHASRDDSRAWTRTRMGGGLAVGRLRTGSKTAYLLMR